MTMKKMILLLVAAAGAVLQTTAQMIVVDKRGSVAGESETVCDQFDDAWLEVRYDYRAVSDTLTMGSDSTRMTFGVDRNEDVMNLLVGKHSAYFYSYTQHLYDSTFNANRMKMFNADGSISVSNFGKRGQTWKLYKNYPEGKLTFTDKIINTFYLIEEELAPQEWEILDGTDTVVGYPCQQARCSFRGRDWVAWFTPEIPVSEGPWKFNGLPGMIMKVADTAGHYSFEAVGVRRVESPMTFPREQYMKVPRKKYWQTYRNYCVDPIGFLNANSGGRITIKSDSPTDELFKPKELKYDFLERDYKK